MAQHVKVAVAGDGADELFGSYLSHRTGRRRGAVSSASPTEPDWAWRASLLVMSDEEKCALYAPDVRAALGAVSRRASTCATAFDGADRPRSAQPRARSRVPRHLSGSGPDVRRSAVDGALARGAQRVSRYRGRRIRGLAAGLAEDPRRRDQASLKQAAARYFPEEMIRRPKEGFLMPVTQWVLGDLQPWVRADAVARAAGAARDLSTPRACRRWSIACMIPGATTRTVNKVAGARDLPGMVRDVSRVMAPSDDILPGTPRVPFSLSMLGMGAQRRGEHRRLHRSRRRVPRRADRRLRADSDRRRQHGPDVGDRDGLPAHASVAEAVSERAESRLRLQHQAGDFAGHARTTCSGRRSTGPTTSAISPRRCRSSSTVDVLQGVRADTR